MGPRASFQLSHSPVDLGCVARLAHTGNWIKVLCFPLTIWHGKVVGTASKFKSRLCYASGQVEGFRGLSAAA
jgi:hypothetical protein